MKFEYSKDQKNALGEKVALCVDYLKQEVQPHIVKADELSVSMGDFLDLYINRDRIYVVETRIINLGLDFPRKRTLYLEKPERKKSKHYICEAAPELAVEFLKHWDGAKTSLAKQVADKIAEVNKINQFVDGFKL